MEATALSVGKAVLDGALDYAKSFIRDEVALQLGVEQDVTFIGDELEMMQSFLMTADEEQYKHKVLLTWVKQVREAAYNVEDSLMDFSAHSDRRPSTWWCIPRAMWVRRDIAKEVKKLRAKVEDVSNRNLRYRLIKGSIISKATTTVDEETNVASLVATFGVNESSHAVEQENSKVDLCQLITNGDMDLRVITVWGSSCDLGKTSLIREAYEHQEVYKRFGCRAWVMLTSPFNANEFFNSLLRQFYVYSREVAGKIIQQVAGYEVHKALEKLEPSHFADQVSAFVDEKRYLIVIDGLTTIVEWDWIKTYFPDKKNGSRIIVSTQHVEVASLCTEQPYQVTELKRLSYDQSIYLFHNHRKLASKSMKAAITDGNNSAKPSDSSGMHEESQQQVVGGKPDRRKTMVATAEDLVGRTNEKCDIINLICDEEDSSQSCRVISVWGMGGLGKTTLVRSVFQSQCLGGWKRAWVTAVRPFNWEAMIRSLVSQLQKDIREDPTTASDKKLGNKDISWMGLQELIAELTRLLEIQQCLIVVDDLSSIEEWDSIKESMAIAGCVIVTTRERSVAMYCSREARNMYSLQRLEDTAAFDLFKKKVFKDNSENVDLHLHMMEKARLILKKCDGLPLAISAVGGFLATKPKTATEWRKTYDRISSELEINPSLRSIKTVLVRSYDGLPYHLKSCFLYMSVFPEEDHKIRRKHLIRRWVAEGYARAMHVMTAEEVGDWYFEDLLDRSMILPGEEVNVQSGKIDSCQLHDIMRQICISKAREESLAFTLEQGCSGLSSTQGAIRHLAISSSWKRENDVFDRILDLSHVRSLTVFGEWRSFFISKKMRFLRVLDLEGTEGIHDHHLDQVGELIHLKYLSLRGCTRINNLPNSFGNLTNLRALEFRRTSVRKLPHSITNVRKLQFLRADGFIAPRGIGKLNALCTLATVEVDENGEGTISEFTQLCHLHKLRIEKITEINNKEVWSAIASLSHLRSLSVNWHTFVLKLDSSLGGSLLPPRSIESLKLGSPLVRLTEWIHVLQNLSRLHLFYAELQQDAMEAVGKLPNLAILVMLWRSFKDEELVFKKGSFPSLSVLELRSINDVQFVKFEDGTMHKLELLRIHVWIGLRELSGLSYPTNLKEIQLNNFHISEEFKDNVQEQLAGHSNNIRILRN